MYTEDTCSGHAAHLTLWHHTILPFTTVSFLLPLLLLLPPDSSTSDVIEGARRSATGW